MTWSRILLQIEGDIVRLALFAQAQNPNNNGDPPPEFVIALLVFVGVVLLVWLVVAICFLISLSKALARCHPRNRTMEPGMVWLNLIPLFNLVWQFITVNRVAESLDNEFYDRGWDQRGEDYGRSIGTTSCVLNLLGCIPYCGMLFGIGALVCFIIYWVRIAGFSSQLASRPDDKYEDEYDDEGDERNRGRRGDNRDAATTTQRRDEYDDGLEDRPWERR